MSTVRATSDVWQHFEKTENAGKCLYCAKIIRCTKGSSSNLKRHLTAKHVGIPLKRVNASSSNGECNVEECTPIQQSSAGISRPATMDSFFTPLKPLTSEAKKKQDELLLKLICQESLPFSITESEAFKKYSYGLNPNYELPSRKTVSEAILNREYNKSLQKVKTALENTTKIALTSDGWSNINNTSFYALTAHYIDNDNKLCSNLLECSEFPYQHTGHNIAEWVNEVTEKFDITEKVVALVTDNASNMSSAAKELKQVNHFPCFAHSLSLVVKKSIEKAIETTVDEVKRIVTFFKKSSTATKKLSEVQTQLNYPVLKLKQDIVTRWNSTYDMLERFYKNKIPLLSCLDTIKVKTSLQNKDWIVIEQAIKILQNFDYATKIASSEKTVTLSHMGLLIKILITKTTDLLNEELESSVRKLGNYLIHGLEERFDPMFRNTIVNQAMLLDPRMKRQSFENEENRYEKTYQSIIDIIETIYPNQNIINTATSNSQTQDNQEKDQYRQHLFGDFVSRISIRQVASDPKTKAKQELDGYIASEYAELESDPYGGNKTNLGFQTCIN
uniref:E3 SUMO-protein ligase ZBED1-like n=1 Tax=Anopheles coluzzii TaxID=1518534 RepID=UPI0020FFF1C4|nr:E3 SUMO-protein ligase ZBED1-like [Anopheles coluzzii]